MSKVKKIVKGWWDAVHILLFISSIFIAVGFGATAGALMAHNLFADPVVVTHKGEPVSIYVPLAGVSD